MNKILVLSALIIGLNINNISCAENYKNNFYFENEESVNERKIQLLVLPFKGWNGIQENFYSSLSNKLLEAELKKISKFQIYKDKEFENQINKVNIDDNLENILDYARDRNIKYIIVPNFLQNTLDFNDISNRQDTFIQGAKVVFQVQVIDVSSGDTIYKTDSTLTQTRKIIGSNFYQNIEELFNKQIENITKKIDETFLIKAVIKNENGLITINKGSNDGISEGMIFTGKVNEKTNDNFKYTTNSYLRVSEVRPDKSILTLLSGKKPSNNLEVTETKKNPNSGGFIKEINSNYITLDIGEDQGVKTGQVYRVIESVGYKDSKTGLTYNLDNKDKALILITQTEQNSSEARVIRGIANIKKDMKVLEYKTSYLEPFIKAAFYANKPINSSVNKENILRLSSGFENMKDSYYFDFGINISLARAVNNNNNPALTGQSFAIGGISNINSSIGYNFPILSEYLYIIPILQAGIGSSSINDSTLVLDITPKAAIKFTYNKFSLWAEGGYAANIGLRQSNLPNSSGFLYGLGLSYLF